MLGLGIIELNYSIGVDLGGTNLRAAAVSREGKALDLISRPTNAAAGREAIVSAIAEAMETLRLRHGTANLAGIGIGVPGFIDMREGIIRGSNNLASLEGLPIRAELAARIGCPVILENDANAAALGEAWLGAGRGVPDLVLLTLGTGIGGGIIADGRVLRGADGMAGEIGHMTVAPDGNPCGCGNRGCLEKHASATAVSAMAQLMGLGAGLTARQVYEKAAAGDEKARRIFSSVGVSLGVALATLINVFNAPLFLLGGGLSRGWEFFEPAMRQEVERRSFTWRASKTRIEQAALGDEGGLYGAARLPWLRAD